jgi:hypothetical protein
MRTRFLTLVVPIAALATASVGAAGRTSGVMLGPDRQGPVHIPIVLQGNRAPILVAIVDGVAVRLRFDLGDATPLVLQKTLLESIRAAPTGKSARMFGMDGSFEAPFFRVTHVAIGTAEFSNVIARQDQARKHYVPDRDTSGWVGTGLLKAFQIIIDYPDRTMTLASGASAGHAGLCTGTVVPFTDGIYHKWRDEPVTRVTTDIGRLTLWWDTGMPASALPKETIKDEGGRTSFTTTRLVLGEYVERAFVTANQQERKGWFRNRTPSPLSRVALLDGWYRNPSSDDPTGLPGRSSAPERVYPPKEAFVAW